MHVEGVEDGKTLLAEMVVDGRGHARGGKLVGESLATHGVCVAISG